MSESDSNDDAISQFEYVQMKIRETSVAAIEIVHAALFSKQTTTLTPDDLKSLITVLEKAAFLFNGQFVEVSGDPEKDGGLMDDDEDGFRPFPP